MPEGQEQQCAAYPKLSSELSTKQDDQDDFLLPGLFFPFALGSLFQIAEKLHGRLWPGEGTGSLSHAKKTNVTSAWIRCFLF